MKNVKIYDLQFMCVKLSEADFSDFAAIYVILCIDKEGTSKVIDVGQSGELGSRIDSHDRKECWKKYLPDCNIWVCIYRMPSSKYSKEQRVSLEGNIRDYYKPVCGKI